MLEDVTVIVEPYDDNEGLPWKVDLTIPVESLQYNQPETVYVLLSMPDDGRIISAFNATLKFKVKDVDPTTGEPESSDTFDDTYIVRRLRDLKHRSKNGLVGHCGNSRGRLCPANAA
jgi:coatomer protein complex subunit gamma